MARNRMARDQRTAGDPAVACMARAPMAATHRAGHPVARAFMARRSLAHVPVAGAGRTPAGLARDRLRTTGPTWAAGLLRVTAAVCPAYRCGVPGSTPGGHTRTAR